MKFADVKAEKIRLVEAADDLTKKTNRSWRVRWAHDLYPGLRIDINIASFKLANGDINVDVGLVPAPPREASRMNADDLAVLALARRIVERWMAGELDELPAETPNEIVGLVWAQSRVLATT
jgi:hypothetical protein